MISVQLVRRDHDWMHVRDPLAEAEAMDASDFSDVCIDTTGMPVAEVGQLVRERTAGWPSPAAPGEYREQERSPAGTADGPILWLCGATGVGKSTVGFDLYVKHVLGRQISGAYVDLDQIGFCGATESATRVNHRMRARILAAMWTTFRAAGAQCLVMVGPAEDRVAITTYAAALPAAPITVCRLHAGRDELTRRIMLRGRGGSWAQPGDPLRGQPASRLADIADKAVADADAMDRARVGDLCIGTDRSSAGEVVDAVIAGSGWLTGAVVST